MASSRVGKDEKAGVAACCEAENGEKRCVFCHGNVGEDVISRVSAWFPRFICAKGKMSEAKGTARLSDLHAFPLSDYDSIASGEKKSHATSNLFPFY